MDGKGGYVFVVSSFYDLKVDLWCIVEGGEYICKMSMVFLRMYWIIWLICIYFYFMMWFYLSSIVIIIMFVMSMRLYVFCVCLLERFNKLICLIFFIILRDCKIGSKCGLIVDNML